ncbi:MAG: hypothetical protein ACRDAU_06940 [Clostridium sp.]
MKKKLIITLVVVLVVCGAGGIIAMNSMDKVGASSKVNTAIKSSKNVEQNNKKDTNANEQATVTKSTDSSAEASQQNSSPSKNQNGSTINQNNKATTNPKNTNQGTPVAVTNGVKSTSQENTSKNTSNATQSSSSNNNESMELDSLLNNLYTSSWHQIRAIDSSFDKNGETGQLFDLIQFEVTPTIIKQKYGIDNLAKANLKATIVKTQQPKNNNIIWINMGGVDPKLEGYYDEITLA